MTQSNTINIESKIYVVRGHRVMLDSDLAELYGVATKVLNQSVRRNLSRFPSDFSFQLTENEEEFLRSQIVTLKTERRGGRGYRPLVFTEFGVAMLSSVLKSERAIEVNISIMRIFGKMREVLESNTELAKRINDLESKFDSQFKDVFFAIRQLMSEKNVPIKRIIAIPDRK